MNILIAADGSPYTERMLAYIGTHEDLLGPKHGYTVITAALKISDRAAGSVATQVLARCTVPVLIVR
ncbi:hypothetical protein GCM10007242_28220 [Pigmentiphaga litoralis]|nr:hypothetical protein GCM10007242_28220 [Pigmentiphaga litoralis]